LAQKSGSSEKLFDVVLIAIARDRSGVVESIAKVVADQSGNWVDSSMARLGGEFAGIVRVEVPKSHVGKLEKALAGLAKDDIDVTVHTDTTHAAPSGQHARLELTGLDHVGIVLEITHILAENEVSIDELKTTVSRGSMGAEPMFYAQADIVLPEPLGIDDLREALEQIAGDVMVDVELADPGGA